MVVFLILASAMGPFGVVMCPYCYMRERQGYELLAYRHLVRDEGKGFREQKNRLAVVAVLLASIVVGAIAMLLGGQIETYRGIPCLFNGLIVGLLLAVSGYILELDPVSSQFNRG